jgi:hypothetical protein
MGMTETMSDLNDQFLATITPDTRDIAENIAGYRVEQEYGIDVSGHLPGALVLGTAAVTFDIRALWMEKNGNDRGLEQAAGALLKQLVDQGLADRLCQCPAVSPSERGRHGHIGACARHYEADVPTIKGNLLCGTCHIAEFEAQQS